MRRSPKYTYAAAGGSERRNEIRCAIEAVRDETRAAAGRIRGTLLTYGEVAADRQERFLEGALRWADEGLLLNVQHDRGRPLLRFRPEVRGAAVVVDAPVPDTTAGRDALTNIRAGVYSGLSIEFWPDRETWSGSMRTIQEARLTGAALVDTPAYSGSAVEARARGSRRSWLVEVVPWL